MTFKHAASTEYKHAHLWSNRCLDNKKKKNSFGIVHANNSENNLVQNKLFFVEGEQVTLARGHNNRDTFRQNFCHATETNLQCYSATYIEVPATTNRHHNKCLTNNQQTSYVITKKKKHYLPHYNMAWGTSSTMVTNITKSVYSYILSPISQLSMCGFVTSKWDYSQCH